MILSDPKESNQEAEEYSDEFIDRQFDELEMEGIRQGNAFNVHSFKVPVTK